MKIGIFGTGGVGRTLAAKLAALGHDVMIGTRDPKATMAVTEKSPMGGAPFKEWHASNSGIRLGTHAEAAAHGELLLNATSGYGSLPALAMAREADLDGKVMMDISNPLDFSKGMPPSLFISNTDSLGEQIQRSHPKLRVVKTLNTMTAALMVEPTRLSEATAVFMSGNDAMAKDVVRGMLKSFGWNDADIIDLGDITTARGAEQVLPIWVRLWGALQTPYFNFRIVKG